eukprot:2365288-Rhodomonas_salina.3
MIQQLLSPHRKVGLTIKQVWDGRYLHRILQRWFELAAKRQQLFAHIQKPHEIPHRLLKQLRRQRVLRSSEPDNVEAPVHSNWQLCSLQPLRERQRRGVTALDHLRPGRGVVRTRRPREQSADQQAHSAGLQLQKGLHRCAHGSVLPVALRKKLVAAQVVWQEERSDQRHDGAHGSLGLGAVAGDGG